MPPQKRKQPHDGRPEIAVADAPVRRSTRQHPDAGAAPEDQFTSGRRRQNAAEKSTTREVPGPTTRVEKVGASKAVSSGHSAATIQARTTRRRTAAGSGSGLEAEASEQQEYGDDDNDKAIAAAAVVSSASSASKENVRPPTPPGDGETRHVAQSKTKSYRHQARRDAHARSRSPPQPTLRQSSPSQSRVLAPRPSQQPVRSIPVAFSSGSASSAGAVPITPKRTQTNKPKIPKTPGTPHSDRNIDTIVFGRTCFKAWYPSYYGKDVLGDVPTHVGGANAKIGGGKRDPPMLDRLYICPCCFKYSKDMMPWRKHVRCCETKAFVPGTKVYTHPRHSTSVAKPRTRSTSPSPVVTAKGKGKSRGDNSNQPVDGPTPNEGEWSVWEVDGERDKLFCQNLSLFAKLFLDNKSVFFDVSGFNYFLLVYTPPPLPETHTAPPMQSSPAPKLLARSDSSAPVSSSPQVFANTPSPSHPRPQIVGFFSKEKMSWDNNNLACILVFPPWQRKGLGALLMGVSYEISRREGILGGPEKPISELGRKGYKRFWAGEITRWILELELPASSSTEASHPIRHTMKREKEKDKVKEQERERESVIVDVGQCSQATWIAPEDCLAVLRDMGVVEEDGLGLPRLAQPDAAGRDRSADPNTQGKAKEEKEKEKEKEPKATTLAPPKAPLVPRVRIDKKALRAWACRNHVELSRACDPDGFVEGYAVPRAGEDDKGE